MLPSDERRHIAVFDIGKTNSRVIIADIVEGREVRTFRMENRVLPGPPYPHLDVEGQADFLMRSLGEAAAEGPLDGVIVIAHGATCALVGDAGLVLPVLDYEYAGPDEIAADYDSVRPPFQQTGSPRMPGGLNVGAQLFWLRDRFPDQVKRARHALFWPQYWTWRLTGRAVSEVSYASSHGDVWDLSAFAPAGGAMADVIGGLFPGLAPAHEVAGVIRPELAQIYGLPKDIPVFVGAHDSSLALVPHAGAGEREPSVVMSTGTWLTAFAIGVEHMPRAESPGVMASLDLFGRLVPNYRLMAGKARADLLEVAQNALPMRAAEACRLHQDPDSGTFWLVDSRTGQAVQLTVPDGDDRAYVLDRFLAKEALQGMRAIGASGPIQITGPFAGNRQFVEALEKQWPFPIVARSYEESLVAQLAALFAEAEKLRQSGTGAGTT